MKSPQLFIFGSLCFLLFFSTGGALYAGVETGELDKKVVKPASEILNGIQNNISGSLEEKDTNTWQNGSSVNIETHTNVNINSNSTITDVSKQTSPKTNQYQIHWVYPTFPPNADYNQTQKNVDEWWAQIKSRNQQFSEESKTSLEKFRQESQQRLEQFKLEGEKGMEDFRKEMEEKQKQFLLEHGITP